VKVYTANELQALVDRAFQCGLMAGRGLSRTSHPDPPRLIELIDHPIGPDPKMKPLEPKGSAGS